MNVGVYGLPDSVRQNVLGFAVCVSNSGTAYRLSEQDGLTPMPEELFVGTLLRFKADLANTGPATLQVGTSAAASLVKRGNAVLIAADIAAGQIVEVVFDGTNWQIISQLGQPVVKYVKFAGVARLATSNTTAIGNVGYFLTSLAHYVEVGDRVNITGHPPGSTDFNVSSAVVITVPTSVTFTYVILNTGQTTPATGTVNTAIKIGNGVSSVTRNGAGDYTVNFTSSYVSANYLTLATAKANTVTQLTASIHPTDTNSVNLKRVFTCVGVVATDAREVNFRAEGL